MKSSLLVLLTVIFITQIQAQEKCYCNYIESDYYQDVFNANLEYWRENNEKVYEYLQLAESKCTLRNLLGYYDVEKYIPLLLKADSLAKAIYYIEYLMSEQGYSLSKFEDDENFAKLIQLPNWNSICAKLLEIEENFVPDTALALKFYKMEERDQYYRRILVPYYHPDSVDVIKNNPIYEECVAKQHLADDSNFNELIAFFNEHGSPLYSKFKLNMEYQVAILNSITGIIVHSGLDSTKLPILEKLLLTNIESGHLHPDTYAFMIDRICLQQGKPYIYGVFENINNGNIYDYENLDKRRKAIGLHSFALEKEYNDLFNEVKTE
jgi:hypothetical protein